MITGDYDYLNNLAKYNVCATHKTHLEVAWYQKQWCLRCGGGGGHYPDAITRQLSLTQEYKAGKDIPEPIKSNIEKGMRRRAMTQGNKAQSTGVSLIPSTDLGSGALLLPEQIAAMVAYAKKYELDPERGHGDYAFIATVKFTKTKTTFTGLGIVTGGETTAKSSRDPNQFKAPVVLMYGKPYITIDGYIFHAALSLKPYTLESHPLNLEEREQYKIGEVVAAHPWQMA